MTSMAQIYTFRDCKQTSLKFMGYIDLYKAQSTHSSSPRQGKRKFVLTR